MIIKTIQNNITGSIQLFGWLFGLRRKVTGLSEIDGNDRYSQLLNQPSVPLLPAEPRFCPTCHILVAYTRETKEGTQIIRNGRVCITAGGVTVRDKTGKSIKGFPISCPYGHEVIL